MTTVTWVAVIPDPCTGADVPLCDSDGNRLEWQFRSKEEAESGIRPTLERRYRHLASIISALELELRRQRPKPPGYQPWHRRTA